MNASIGFIQRLSNLFTNVLIVPDSPLETYCKENFTRNDDIAYKNKRRVDGLSYAVTMNELIQPRAYEVRNLRGKDVYARAADGVLAIGDVCTERIKWDDDNNLDKSGDYYLAPSETITRKKGDCEDIAFVVASMMSDFIGVAYGFLNGGGHAFNVFVSDGRLYFMDCTSRHPITGLVSAQTSYVIHYIVTERFTFLVKSGVRFGDIAGWKQ